MSVGIKTGDVIRLYGYPGTFVAGRKEFRHKYDHVEVMRNGKTLWWSPECSVVEVNGTPIPMRSCPLVPPAEDYPHEPQFDYGDGPVWIGLDMVKRWKESNCEEHHQNPSPADAPVSAGVKTS